MMTGSFGLALLDLRQQFEAALAGQRQIEQDEIEALAFEHAQALLAIGGGPPYSPRARAALQATRGCRPRRR